MFVATTANVVDVNKCYFFSLLLLLVQCVVVTDCWQLFSHRKNLLSHKQHTKFIFVCTVVVAIDILNILPQGSQQFKGLNQETKKKKKKKKFF